VGACKHPVVTGPGIVFGMHAGLERYCFTPAQLDRLGACGRILDRDALESWDDPRSVALLREAEILVGRKLRSVDDIRAAAIEIHLRFGCAALVKGGHLRGAKAATDVFFDGRDELTLSAPFVRGVETHGTGCTYSAAIAGYLALGLALAESVELAKNHITQAIAQSVRIAKHTALEPFWK